jgi:hypothetical protein
MNIKGLENLVSIVGQNGEIRQGLIEWVGDGEFWLSENGKVYQRIWGKTDYWKVIGGICFGRIGII